MANTKRSVEKEQFWRLVLDEQAKSGLTVRAFCRQEGISEPSFYAWRRELAVRDGQVTPASARNVKAAPLNGKPPIIPVQVVGLDSSPGRNAIAEVCPSPLPASQPAMIEVATSNGFTLRAEVATDANAITAWLSAIIKVDPA